MLALVFLAVGWVVLKIYRYQQRKQMLISRFGPASAARILAQQAWLDMSEDELMESWGTPVEKGYELKKTTTKETWKYNQTGKGRFASRISLENGRVSAIKRT